MSISESVKIPGTPDYLLISADDEFQELCFAFGLELDEVVCHLNFTILNYINVIIDDS